MALFAAGTTRAGLFMPNGAENDKHVPGYLRSTAAQQNRSSLQPFRTPSPTKPRPLTARSSETQSVPGTHRKAFVTPSVLAKAGVLSPTSTKTCSPLRKPRVSTGSLGYSTLPTKSSIARAQIPTPVAKTSATPPPEYFALGREEDMTIRHTVDAGTSPEDQATPNTTQTVVNAAATEVDNLIQELRKRNADLSKICARQHEVLERLRGQNETSRAPGASTNRVDYEVGLLLDSAGARIKECEEDNSILRDYLKAFEARFRDVADVTLENRSLAEANAKFSKENTRLEREIASSESAIQFMQEQAAGISKTVQEKHEFSRNLINSLKRHLDQSHDRQDVIESIARGAQGELVQCQQDLDKAKNRLDQQHKSDQASLPTQEELDDIIKRVKHACCMEGEISPEADDPPARPVQVATKYVGERKFYSKQGRCGSCQLEALRAYARAYRRFRNQHSANHKAFGPIRSRSRYSFPTSELLEVAYKSGHVLRYKTAYEANYIANKDSLPCGVDHGKDHDHTFVAPQLTVDDIEGTYVCSMYDFDFPTPESRRWKKYMFTELKIHVDGTDLSSRDEREEWWYAIMCNKARGLPWWDEPTCPDDSKHSCNFINTPMTFAPLTETEKTAAKLAAILYVRFLDSSDWEAYETFKNLQTDIEGYAKSRQSLAKTRDVFISDSKILAKSMYDSSREQATKGAYVGFTRFTEFFEESTTRPEVMIGLKGESYDICPEHQHSKIVENKSCPKSCFKSDIPAKPEALRKIVLPQPGVIYSGRYEDDDVRGEGPITWTGTDGYEWKVCNKHRNEDGMDVPCPPACFEPEKYDEADSTMEIPESSTPLSTYFGNEDNDAANVNTTAAAAISRSKPRRVKKGKDIAAAVRTEPVPKPRTTKVHKDNNEAVAADVASNPRSAKRPRLSIDIPVSAHQGGVGPIRTAAQPPLGLEQPCYNPAYDGGVATQHAHSPREDYLGDNDFDEHGAHPNDYADDAYGHQPPPLEPVIHSTAAHGSALKYKSDSSESSSDEDAFDWKSMEQVVALMNNAGLNVVGSSSMRHPRAKKTQLLSSTKAKPGSSEETAACCGSGHGVGEAPAPNSVTNAGSTVNQYEHAESGPWMTNLLHLDYKTSSSSSESEAKQTGCSNAEDLEMQLQQLEQARMLPLPKDAVHAKPIKSSDSGPKQCMFPLRVVTDKNCQPWHTSLPSLAVLRCDLPEIKLAVLSGKCWDCAKADLFERFKTDGPMSVSGSSQRQTSGRTNSVQESSEQGSSEQGSFVEGSTIQRRPMPQRAGRMAYVSCEPQQ